jgi:hypothetical protein
MDQYNSPSVVEDTNQWSAWALSRVGNAIDAYVDRQILGPQYLNGGYQQYGQDAYGKLYPLGQPSGQVIGQVQPNSQQISPLMLLLIVGAIFLVAK